MGGTGIRITYEELDIRRDGTIWYNGELKYLGKTKKGYLRCKFNGGCESVHRLIAQKYIPNPENKEQVNHINGIKTDNRVDNLEWVTASENIKHAYETGLIDITKNRRLTMEQAREIREKYSTGDYNTVQLSEEYDVSIPVINKIIKNKSYIDNEYNYEPKKVFRKINQSQREEIKSKYVPRKYPLSKLAKEYGVTHGVIWRIIQT